MKLGTKLAMLTVIPLALALGLGGYSLWVQSRTWAELQTTLADVGYLGAASRLVAAVQNERGTATLVQSGGAQATALDEASTATDEARKTWAKTKPGSTNFGDQEAIAVAGLDKVAGERDSVKSQGLTANRIFSDYTAIIDALLETCRLTARNAAPGAAYRLLGLVTLEEAKEWTGRTRALGAAILSANDPIDDDTARDLMSRFGSIGSLLGSRILDLSVEDTSARADAFASDDFKGIGDDVLMIIRKASAGKYGHDPQEFFKQATSFLGKIQAIIEGEQAAVHADLSRQAASQALGMALAAAILALALVAVIIGSLIVLRGVLRRVASLTKAFGEIAAGEGDLTVEIPVGSNDELGKLASDFNSFTATLRSLVANVKAEAASIEAGAEELAANMHETTGAVQEIAATIDSIKQQGLAQAASVTESSATIEEIAKRTGTLGDAIERQAGSLSGSSSSIEEMVANVQSVTVNVERMGSHYQRLDGSSSEGRQAILRLAAQAKDIDSQSVNLQEANALIAGIAARTNLLAMNAAIEAAHAGEAGKGFAVVADEIRSLAENAATQSKAVAKNLSSIRKAITGVVESSSDAERTFGDIVEQIGVLSRLEEEVKSSMQEQSAGSAQILEALAGMNAVTSEVRAESSMMREGSGAVLEEMKTLMRLTTELENGLGEMATGAEEIRESAVKTNDLTVKSADSARALGTITSKFRT